MIDFVILANITIAPITKIVLFFEDMFNIFDGVRTFAIALSRSVSTSLRSRLLWIIAHPLFSSGAGRFWIFAILISAFFQVRWMVYGLTIQHLLYQPLSVSIIIASPINQSIGFAIGNILVFMSQIFVSFLFFDFICVFYSIFSPTVSTGAIKTIRIATRLVEVFRGCWKKTLALCALLVHSFSLLLTRLWMAPDDASDRFSGATLDAFVIIT